MNTSQAYRNIPWYHLRCGDTVARRDDPRHTGRVVAIFNSTTVKVRWDDTQWVSDESAAELEKVR